MNNIVIAFPKKEVANSIKKILAQSGYTVTAVANTQSPTPSRWKSVNKTTNTIELTSVPITSHGINLPHLLLK